MLGRDLLSRNRVSGVGPSLVSDKKSVGQNNRGLGSQRKGAVPRGEAELFEAGWQRGTRELACKGATLKEMSLLCYSRRFVFKNNKF